MMRTILSVIMLLLVFVTGCNNPWDDIVSNPEKIDQNFWDDVKSDSELSMFVNYMEENEIDTIFQQNKPFTVFVPKNAAIEEYMTTEVVDTNLLKYHISEFFIQSVHTSGIRKIRTLNNKLAQFEKTINGAYFDGNIVVFESPLYKNGKYFILEKVAEPKPNLYEFFAINNRVLKDYIDSQDSIVLDQERSVPIGFDEDGNTIYDSVSIVYNSFYEDYFPVNEEHRNKSATIVFPLEEDYQNALTIMAQSMNSNFSDYNDIPDVWQQEVLIPYLIDKGVFENLLEPVDFFKHPEQNGLYKVKNILGDSVEINYNPVDKSICSNGYAYNYSNFFIPDSLYNTASRFEMESLLEASGFDKYNWSERASVVSDIAIPPYREYIGTASNDSILRVLFPLGYNGQYSVEFETQNLFPRRYLMVVRTHMDYGGIYDIYVNDELVKTFDYYDFIFYRGILPSVTGDYYILQGRYNRFDMYVDNITEFGKAKVKFDYKGPGDAPSNGFVIDYIDFVPVEN